jgi:uncharacterized protein (TIGR00299 family) protein
VRLIYFDCFSGASGDMILGALIDAGLPVEALREALGSLVPGEAELRVERVLRAGIAATKFTLVEGGDGADPAQPGGHHPHHGHAHRSLRDIEALIGRSRLSPAGKARAISLFGRLGAVEAAIHRMPLDRVHLHEVGALDSIVDIVGGVFALEWFGADEVVASPLNVGSGSVKTAHGVLPVPAPATAALLEGVPVYSEGPAVELLTPTGALLLTGHASRFGPLPAMTIERAGYGAGDRDFKDRPNVLRVLVGETAARQPDETVLVLECEIDDMSPQFYGPLVDRLLGEGALDVYYTAVQMKRNRPGTLVTVLAPPASRAALTSVLMRETTTLGVRYHEVRREVLDREIVEVDTEFGRVRIKVARRGGEVLNVMPEFEDCVRLATARGVGVKQVHLAALRAIPLG